MLVTRRRVVEEVTQVISDTNIDDDAGGEHKKQLRQRMKYERERRRSFDLQSWLYPSRLDLTVAQLLAKNGFYNCGKIEFSFSTACFSCGLQRPAFFWQEGNDPERVHREESPDCLFINGQSDNVPIDPTEDDIQQTVFRTERPKFEFSWSDHVSIENKDQNNNRFANGSVPVPLKDLDPATRLEGIIKTGQIIRTKDNLTTLKQDIEIDSGSKKQNSKQNQERDASWFSTKLRSSSVQTREPDNTPANPKQQHLISDCPENNIEKSVEVSIRKILL